MDASHQHIIRTNYVTIRNQLEDVVEDVTDSLFAKGRLTDNMRKDIKRVSPEFLLNQFCLNVLLNKHHTNKDVKIWDTLVLVASLRGEPPLWPTSIGVFINTQQLTTLS